MTRAKRLMSLLNGVTLSVALWAAFFPAPYYPALAACFVMPLLAIGVRVWHPGTTTREESGRKRYRRSFTTLMMMSATALICRALSDLNLFDWQALAAWSLLVAACICGVAYWFDAGVRNSWRQALPVLLFALLAGYSLVAFGDTLLDPFALKTSFAAVAKKHVHVSGGARGSSPSYRVLVVPSPPGRIWLLVRPDIYDELRVGQRVCVSQGNGLFGIGWLDVRPCKSS